MTQEWSFEDSGPCLGSLNMELDEHLALGLLSGSGRPTVRVYRWDPWAVSLGYHQDRNSINDDKCRVDGIDIIRRPTGGRAVLHAEELTYCVAMYSAGKTISETYGAISKAIVRGLNLFGIAAELQRVQPDFADHYRNESSTACFSSSARHEVMYNGRKLVGSAQRRYGSGDRCVVLQHGSILLGPAHQRLAMYLNLGSEDRRLSVARELLVKTAHLGEIVGEVSIDELMECVQRGFEEMFDISFKHRLPSQSGRITYA